MPLNLPYYYGHSGEQYAFFRIPKLLLTDARFAEISTDAKLLYGLLLDRMELSYRNGWIDEQNRVFIIFTAEEVMSTLRCRSEKAARLFSELDSAKGIGLIERKTFLVRNVVYFNFNTPFSPQDYSAISRDSIIEFQDIRFPNFWTFDNRTLIRLRYSKTENRKNTTRKKNNCKKQQLC